MPAPQSVETATRGEGNCTEEQPLAVCPDSRAALSGDAQAGFPWMCPGSCGRAAGGGNPCAGLPGGPVHRTQHLRPPSGVHGTAFPGQPPTCCCRIERSGFQLILQFLPEVGKLGKIKSPAGSSAVSGPLHFFPDS